MIIETDKNDWDPPVLWMNLQESYDFLLKRIKQNEEYFYILCDIVKNKIYDSYDQKILDFLDGKGPPPR